MAKDIQEISSLAQKRAAPLAYQVSADHITKQLKDESETWKLVSELFSAEALYFNRKPLSGSLCPKTRQLEMLSQSHEALAIHAVSAWLEKI